MLYVWYVLTVCLNRSNHMSAFEIHYLYVYTCIRIRATEQQNYIHSYYVTRPISIVAMVPLLSRTILQPECGVTTESNAVKCVVCRLRNATTVVTQRAMISILCYD